MIKYVKHHFIDKPKYDHCIKLDEHGLTYGFSWYLDTVCESWDALVLNDYDAVWPLPVRRKFGVKYFFRPFAVQQLGIFSKIVLEDHQYTDFVRAMTEACQFADIYLNENQLVAIADTPGMQTQINRNYLLDINTSYRQIYHGYNTNTRRAIKKSNEQDLQIFEHDSPDVLMDLFRHNKGAELKLSEAFYRSFKKLMFQALHRGVGKLWTVYGAGNRICAGAFFLESKSRSTLLFTGLDEVGKSSRAMFFLLNEYIILHSEKGKLLDFEGSNDAGVARFYQGFGAREFNYQQLKYNGLPMPLRWLKK